MLHFCNYNFDFCDSHSFAVDLHFDIFYFKKWAINFAKYKGEFKQFDGHFDGGWNLMMMKKIDLGINRDNAKIFNMLKLFT